MRLNNTPVLETERLILRKFTENDIEAILEIYKDPEVNTFLPWFPIETMEEAKTLYEEAYARVPPRLAAQRADGHSNSVTWKSRMVLPVRGRSNHELRSVALPLFAETGSQPVTRIFCRHARGAVSIIAFELWI